MLRSVREVHRGAIERDGATKAGQMPIPISHREILLLSLLANSCPPVVAVVPWIGSPSPGSAPGIASCGELGNSTRISATNSSLLASPPTSPVQTSPSHKTAKGLDGRTRVSCQELGRRLLMAAPSCKFTGPTSHAPCRFTRTRTVEEGSVALNQEPRSPAMRFLARHTVKPPVAHDGLLPLLLCRPESGLRPLLLNLAPCLLQTPCFHCGKPLHQPRVDFGA